MQEKDEYKISKKPERSIINVLRSKFIISPENIAHSVYPIVEAIHEIKPDYILALDRGGRIVGLATHMLYRKLYGRLPTQDHAIHFTKVSRRLPSEINYQHLKPVAENLMRISCDPKVLIIDDWMNTGKTKKRIMEVLSEISDNHISVYFGMLRGRGENVTADRFSVVICSWVNNSNLIGVEYSEETGRPKSLHSQSAIIFRRKISQNIKKFVEREKAFDRS